AEDGIRDFHVTGVQTCALPILLEELELLGREVELAAAAERHVLQAIQLEVAIHQPLRASRSTPPQQRAHPREQLVELEGLGQVRSEERRVGKECRSGGSAYQEE